MEAVNIYPELLRHRVGKQGLAPIILRFDQNNNHIGFENTGHKVPPDYWDAHAKRVKNKYPNASLINGLIDRQLSRHKNFILRRQALSLPVNKQINFSRRVKTPDR